MSNDEGPPPDLLQTLNRHKQDLGRRLEGVSRRLPWRSNPDEEPAADEQAPKAAGEKREPERRPRFPGNPELRELADRRRRLREDKQQSKEQSEALIRAAVDSDRGFGISVEESSAAWAASDSRTQVVAVEITKGRRRVYSRSTDGDVFLVHDEMVNRNTRVKDVLSKYMLPNGFPHSVAPEYSHYMFWRGVQYFFGGAMSVFTTRSLLGALGVNGRGANEASAAINWVLKDGAGRLGRFLFARWGRQLDCEVKQFRLAGDLLMQTGAALELSTIAAPGLFLPLACTANLAKNLAAVANSATRAPIYKTFALDNNMADITAKGESVANLADIMGTLFGILLARSKLPVVPCFTGLSFGYLYASRREVDSVVLPYLNPARLAYTAKRYLENGAVPSTQEANRNEPLLLLPWRDRSGLGEMMLGARIEDACSTPHQLAVTMSRFADLPYAVSYRADKKQMAVMLRESASPRDLLQAAFHGHYLLHVTCEARQSDDIKAIEALIDQTVKTAPKVFKQFHSQAASRGWQMDNTMLDVSDHRLMTILNPKPI